MRIGLIRFMPFSCPSMSLLNEIHVDSHPDGHMKAFKKKLAEVRASPPWMKPVIKEASEWNPYSFEGGLASQKFSILMKFSL